MKERLDRGVTKLGWRDIFLEVDLVMEASTVSDHAVLKVVRDKLEC
jgi:hypothetical protein